MLAHFLETLAERDRRPSDAVIEWIAPFPGEVDVTGALAIADQAVPSPDPDWDGVRLRIYRADEVAGAFETELIHEASTGVAYAGGPVGVSVPAVPVAAGTRLYFVLSTLSDFPILPGSRSPAEEASFVPRIAYRNVPAADRDRVDPTGARAFVFDAADDFRLGGGGPQGAVAPAAGRVRIESTIEKRRSTANVRYCIQRYPESAERLDLPCNGAGFALVALREHEAAAERTEAFDVETNVDARDRLVFRVETNISFDPRAVDWRIQGRLTHARDDQGALQPVHPSMAGAATFLADPFVPLHVSVDPYQGTGGWSAVPDPYPMLPLIVPESGQLEIVTRQAAIHAPAEDVWLAARTSEFLVFEQPASDSPKTVRIPVTLGDEIFFEVHSHDGADVDWQPTVTLVPASGGSPRVLRNGADVPINRTRDAVMDSNGEPHQIRSPFAGGYHGWRYGAWHGENAESFDPNGMIVLAPYVQGRLWEQLARALGDPTSLESRAVEATSPLFPRRLGTFAGGTRSGLKPGVPAWVSLERQTFVTSTTMHGSREYVVDGLGRAEALEAFAPAGVLRASGGANELSGIDFFGIAGLNRTHGTSRQFVDLVDMNGDGMLDRLITGVDIRFSGFEPIFRYFTLLDTIGPNDLTARPRVVFNYPVLRENSDVGGTANIGKTMAFSKMPSDSSTIDAVVGAQAFTVGVGAALGVNLSSANTELIDVNGDGLPDIVSRPASCLFVGPCFTVRLNLGTGRFGRADAFPVRPWGDGLDGLAAFLAGGDETTFGPDRVRRTTATTLKSSVGAAFIFGVSESWESSIAQTSVQFVDVNGDGLPDYVRKGSRDGEFLRVMLNTGTGFLPESSWRLPGWPSGATQPFLSGRGLFGGAFNTLFNAATNGFRRIDAVEANGSWTPSGGIGWGVQVTVPIGPISITGSYGEEESIRASGLQLGMMDLDGDGLADHVLKAESRDDGTSNADVHVRLNRLGKANLLKRVTRPLGGKIDLSYARAGNTVAMPSHRWVMSGVIVRDGRGAGDRGTVVPGHDVVTTYAYEGGRHDRYERDFLGFAEVTRTNADGTRMVQTYRNDRVAFKELLASERVETADRRVLVETVNEYRNPYAEPRFRLMDGIAGCEEKRPFSLRAEDYFCGSLYPAPHRTTKRFYEGERAARVEARQVFDHEPATGNVTGFDDLGDTSTASAGDDLHATIFYYDDALARRIHSISRPKYVEIIDAAGRRLRRRDAEYDGRGNLSRLVSSIDRTTVADTLLHWDELGRLWKVEGPEVAAGRYTLEYGYDDVVRTYRRTVLDSHGYTSTTEWSYRFGEVEETTDAAGQKTRRVLDSFGRMNELYGPYDASTPEIRIEYAHGAPTPYARTRHRLSGGATLDTLVFIDGLGRSLQTKKTAEVEGRGIGWAASGHVRFDAVGRLAVRGLGYFEAGSGTVYRDGTPLHPTLFEYDALGRPTRTEETIEKTAGHLDGKATTTVAYGFGGPPGSPTRLAATVTDPENKVRVLFRDPNDQVVGVEERNAGVPAVTRYEYDPVGQLTDIVDANGNRTRIAYDLLGRRTSLDSPDAGLTEYLLDAAGNVTRRTDGNRQTVIYEYVFDQLRRIDYPQSADVTFEYGPPGASENGAGRIVEVVDDAGSETRGYGPLGELVRATRTVRPFRPGDVEKVFETRFSFDAFGRMQWIRYPDGEKVTYGYDAGGLLRSATGKRRASHGDPSTAETYLELLTYDEFGQRRTMRLGNGAVTTYDYYPESRRLRGLATTAGGRTLQALAYRYDRVGNVLEMANALPAATGNRSGPTRFAFGYDDLYRLTSATGTAQSRRGVVDSFSATYGYDASHNMTRNTQVHVVNTLGLPGEGTGHPPATNHDLEYAYDRAKPHQATRIGETHVLYDGNGNVDRECRRAPGCGANADGLRRFYWTEENRLAAVIDGNGSNVTRFVYDASGDRVAKLGRGGESLSIGQFFALKGRKAASKHVFAGATRIATKVSPPPGWQPADPSVVSAPPGEPPSGAVLPGCIPSDYQPNKCPAFPGGDPVVMGPPDSRIRPETYYYHSDHLGSTSWVTDQNGRVHEHVEYFPYGQVWRDVRQDADGPGVKGQRFLFTGKELDEETGLYYFGARYYDPRRSRWLSTDPLLAEATEKLLSAPALQASYAYAMQNPMRMVDPNGEEPVQSRIGNASAVVGRLTSYPGKAESTLRWAARYETFGKAHVRYVYTKQYGYIDLTHFFRATELAVDFRESVKHMNYEENGIGGALAGAVFSSDFARTRVLRGLGFGNEVEQSYSDNPVVRRSAFSSEDIPSNNAGFSFGSALDLTKPFSKQVAEFFRAAGAEDLTTVRSAEHFKALPRTDDEAQRTYDAQSRWPK